MRTETTRAGDPFVAASRKKLAKLEERHAHELMGVEERAELRDRVLALVRRKGDR